MKTKHFLLATSLLLALSACKEQNKKSDNHDAEQTTEHDGNHHSHDSTKTANEYMHRSSTEDLIKRFESPERDAYQKPELVLEYLGNLEGKKIMDIGAGSGYFSVKLAEKGAQVIAADVDDEFQAALQKRIEDNNLENIELRKIPYDSPNLADGEVDMVLIVNTYHHIENRSEYFAKVKQGIKPEGELVVIDYFKKELPVGPPVNHKINLETVKKELKEAGYTELDVNTDLLPYQFIVRAK
ncbi:class I SAM-dependent methyltransferase [Aequorivita echinoideorum]|uniref:Class I SAM-dependent methyltransferase n=1 Tax=Aequorivita echinoideorum TaxID=1549647 RepID=A0ABS5S2Q5_9FLAO|nr:class I SAM-dependent methyltransferase [Aequorivita echinoideorum]MBT0606735.1 class I SAM-dependent methyltransferase [Aequorivita echinoideorum]